MTTELVGGGSDGGGVQLAAVLGWGLGPTTAPFTSDGASKSEARRGWGAGTKASKSDAALRCDRYGARSMKTFCDIISFALNEK